MPRPFYHRTIREHLLGVVGNHLNSENINCGRTHEVGCELVALLAGYREEGRRLFPQVYLLGPGRAEMLRTLAPGSAILVLGEMAEEQGTRHVAVAALKTCASLAIDGWCVFIRRRPKGFDFGLCRPALASYSAGAEDALLSSKEPIALLRYSAENTVEIIAGSGARLEISLTTAMPSTKTTHDPVSVFATAVCSEVEDRDRSLATGYLTRTLTDLLRGSHGTLLAAAPSRKRLDKDKFADGVLLPEPIPLVQSMLGAVKRNTVAEVSLLKSQESLLRGMIFSDGVTMLGTDGSIRAFRVFVRAGSAPSQETEHGGARSRAFAVLRSYVGKALRAALFRSQDGRVEVEVAS